MKETAYDFQDVLSAYGYEGEDVKATAYGNGHINDTYIVEKPGKDRLIIQKINGNVFKNAVGLMENTIKVTEFLRKKIIAAGGDPERETVNVVPTVSGENWFIDAQGDLWRATAFITGATSYDAVEKPEDFYESAVSFGHFQAMLADYPVEDLCETIPGFHDTPARFAKFKKAVEEDAAGRVGAIKEDIDFILEREAIANFAADKVKAGEIPLRVTHNDTKLNNILIDDKTGRGICIIDLDTVMPGLAMNDFGDAIRFGASTAAEDEKDLDKVEVNLELYDIYTKGFVEGCEGKLTEEEIRTLPHGALGITFEQAIRFLTDYIEGDPYYKTAYEDHNLVRARTQIKLVKDMEDKWDTIEAINQKYI